MKKGTAMKKTITTLVILTLIGSVTAPQAAAQGTVNPAIKEALTEALSGPDGEYAAYAEYTAIIEKFGEVLPYVNIRGAEERHINALKGHFEKYGLPVPENKYLGKITVPASLAEAARAGVTAEQRNVAMYDKLLAKVKDNPDLTQVFSNLQSASRDRHLPAFQATAEGKTPACCCGGGGGRGQGQGWGRGPCGRQNNAQPEQPKP
jgi:hypothetical protein